MEQVRFLFGIGDDVQGEMPNATELYSYMVSQLIVPANRAHGE